MAKAFKEMLHNVIEWTPKASTTNTLGELCVEKGSGLEPASAGDGASAVIMGITQETVTSDSSVTLKSERVKVDPCLDKIIAIAFTDAGTKKTFAETDLGNKYDISNATTLNPDDTTGGFLKLVDYDNDNLIAYVVIENHYLRA